MTTSAAAIGYSVISNLGGDRQLTTQCFVGEDEDDSAVNAKLDRMFGFIDRQKAKYEIVDVEADLMKHREMLAQLNEDMARIGLDFDKAQAGLDVQAEELGATRSAEVAGGYNAHLAAGRKGDYAPQGAAASRFRNLDNAIDGIKTEKAKNEAERDQHLAQTKVTIDRWHTAIAERTSKLTSLHALVGG